jgi:serine/threonine protein kinase
VLPIQLRQAYHARAGTMRWRNKLTESWRSALLGAVLCGGLGMALLYVWWGEGLICWSYDLLFRFRTAPSPDEVVIVYMDDRSFGELCQKGIQKFMPISRSHPGLVHVLHVGRNDAVGFFFYIMEVCDDASTGQRIDPERYSPKTLATELAWRGKLPPKECLQLGLSLTVALEHLHDQQLIHRDIKPGNIIYVHDTPKFADIGLVTDIQTPEQNVSRLGTEGYVPPEGPGTPAADVYALGKVLYEASMGRDRRLFPEVPTAVLEQSADVLLRRINDVIGKACETNAHQRYQRAKELYADLLKLQSSASQQKA